MSIATVALAVMVFGAAVLIVIISSVLADCEDEARRMATDRRQLHCGSDAE